LLYYLVDTVLDRCPASEPVPPQLVQLALA
jgi:hypothetical protein